MKKRIRYFLVMAMVFSLLGGCASSTSQTDGTMNETEGENNLEGEKIAVIMKQQAEQYWQLLANGAENTGETLGVQVDVFAPVEANNNDQQIQLVQEAIAKQYDVICVSPCDSKGIGPAVLEANDAGIPIISYATPVTADGCEVICYIAIDNYDAQYKVTKALCEMMGSGEVIILEGPAGQESAVEKVEGANDAIAEYENIELVASQIANWSRSEAYSVTQNLLQAHPDIKGVVACNDAMAFGAIQALDEAGKSGEVLVCGLNCDPGALEAIENGTLAVDLDTMPYESGGIIVEAAADVLQGKTIDELITLNTTLVTLDNVDEINAVSENN